MRVLLLVAALMAACAAQAQVRPMIVRPPAEDRDDRDHDRRERERDRREHRSAPHTSGTAPMTVVRPPSPPPRERDDERRWRERDERREARPAAKTAPPPSRPSTAPMVARPAPEPYTPPSKAVEMQRRMEEQRRVERGERVTGSGSFRCSAYPVCDRSSGSYGSCRGVDQVYSANSARFARQQVARDCAAVNSPDPCNCAVQCSRVAECGPI